MRGRVSIAGLLGAVAVAAFGLAALCQASQLWVRGVFTCTWLLLAIGLLGAILRTRPRGAWVGFALFGWGSIGILAYAGNQAEFLPFAATDLLAMDLHQDPELPVASASREASSVTPPGAIARAHSAYQSALLKRENAKDIGRLLACLILAFVGSLLGRMLGRRAEPVACEVGAPRTAT